ncbi:unnamed protein product [Cochlearia groenlandica]
MGIFSDFIGLINLNKEQRPKVSYKNESKPTEDDEPKPVSKTYPEDREELKKQLKLWRAYEKKHPWHDYPPKIKVKISKDECLMNMQFTIGLPPEAVYDMFTNYDNQTYFKKLKRPQTLEHKSSKVVYEDDQEKQVVEVKKDAYWKFLWWSGTILVHINFTEFRKDFYAMYVIPTENVMFMKMFEGMWQVEPWYVDSDRYCKPRLPENREEYKRCTRGKGLIASKVTIKHFFQPSNFVNFPPLCWFIRCATINTIKSLAEEFQTQAAVIRGV